MRLKLLWRQVVDSPLEAEALAPLVSSPASSLRELVRATTTNLTGSGTVDPSVPFLDAGLDS